MNLLIATRLLNSNLNVDREGPPVFLSGILKVSRPCFPVFAEPRKVSQ